MCFVEYFVISLNYDHNLFLGLYFIVGFIPINLQIMETGVFC